MNIFLTHKDMSIVAQHHDDKRLNKMIIEAAQIASTALWINNCDIAETMYAEGKIYLPTHENHPIVKWCSLGYMNYCRTTAYGLALCSEYYYRFNKRHNTFTKLLSLVKLPIWEYPSQRLNIQQPNCTTNHKHIENVYEAYRQELCLKWSTLDKHEPKWTKRDVPVFYKEYLKRR